MVLSVNRVASICLGLWAPKTIKAWTMVVLDSCHVHPLMEHHGTDILRSFLHGGEVGPLLNQLIRYRSVRGLADFVCKRALVVMVCTGVQLERLVITPCTASVGITFSFCQSNRTAVGPLFSSLVLMLMNRFPVASQDRTGFRQLMSGKPWSERQKCFGVVRGVRNSCPGSQQSKSAFIPVVLYRSRTVDPGDPLIISYHILL